MINLQLSVVVPVHNECENARELALEIQSASTDCPIQEIIFVNDCSTDHTLDVLQNLREEIPTLRVLSHDSQCGQSAAILSGVRAAKSPWIATMDGDGQNNPEDIRNLVEALVKSDDDSVRLVNGNRNKGDVRKDTVVKRISSKIANKVRSSILKDKTPDSGCGLKLIHRETYLALPWFVNIHRFTPALVIRTGARVISVEVSHRERGAGKSHYGLFNRLWIGIVDLAGVSWLMKKGYVARVSEPK
jgi:dolichol-phosphate mannosyltransferase